MVFKHILEWGKAYPDETAPRARVLTNEPVYRPLLRSAFLDSMPDVSIMGQVQGETLGIWNEYVILVDFFFFVNLT